MNAWVNFLSFVVGALVVFSAGAQATAGTTSDSDTTGLITTDFSNVLSVDQFDPALGTLNQVTLTVTGRLYGGGVFENLNGSPVDSSMRYILDQSLDITQGLTALLGMTKTTDTTLTINVPAYDGTFDYGGTSGYTETPFDVTDDNVFTYTLTLDLAPFIGTGTVDFDAVADATATVYPANGVVCGTYSYAQATIEVVYDYTPVPEPATMCLAGIGAVALLLRKRKQR
jgi:hypothetical protein